MKLTLILALALCACGKHKTVLPAQVTQIRNSTNQPALVIGEHCIFVINTSSHTWVCEGKPAAEPTELNCRRK